MGVSRGPREGRLPWKAGEEEKQVSQDSGKGLGETFSWESVRG